MSIETIGKELLPNVYIKSVNVYDHSDLLNSVDITVCVLDFEDENGDLFECVQDCELTWAPISVVSYLEKPILLYVIPCNADKCP